MSFSPFDGVLLADPRDLVPGSAALLLHLRVERRRAMQDGRAPLGTRAVMGRAQACRDLMGRGLLPAQLRGLGLTMGPAREAGSLASLIAHLEDYLAAVAAAGYLEPMAALWTAAEAEASGGLGFLVERSAADGALDAYLSDLAPPRLRALLALRDLGPLRFRLPTHRGDGSGGLFEGRAPHLVNELLPGLEALAAQDERVDVEAPAGWARNAWGHALDALFEGPLDLDDSGRTALWRALLPTPFAVLGAAVEQVCAWVDSGIPPGEITLVHPESGRIAACLDGLLQAEGLGLSRVPGASLLDARDWAPLMALLEGLLAGDPAQLAGAFAASKAQTPFGQALGAFAKALEASDEAGIEAIRATHAGLPGSARASLGARVTRLLALPELSLSFTAWTAELEKLALGFELLDEGTDFHPALGLFQRAWAGEAGKVDLWELADALGAFLSAGTTAPREREGGIRLLGPSALVSGWPGSRATILLDLGEGAWPSAPALPPDLDEGRRALLNAALRKASPALGFPPGLQAFPLSRAEADEALPRAFHAEALAFNAALALTREAVVALSSGTGEDGHRRSQGPFWKALEGAGAWTPDSCRAASTLRHRIAAGAPSRLAQGRQVSMRVADPDSLPALHAESPREDRTPGWWIEGLDAGHPVSPTKLEALARCPFRVFAEQGLGLDVWPSGPSLALGIGSAVHGLLQTLLLEFVGCACWPAAFLERHGLASPDPVDLEALLGVAWAEARARILARLYLSAQETARVDRAVEDMQPDLAVWLAWDLAQREPLPEEILGLELRGEGLWDRSLEGLELEVGPVALLDPPRWFKGRVDRVERWTRGDESFLRLMDYKSSSPQTLKGHADHDGFTATHLQLPLYQRMLEAQSGLPVSAWLVPLRGFQKPLPAMFAAQDAESRARLEEHVSRLLARAEAGEFVAVPGDACAACSLAALCGRPVDLEALESEGDEAGGS